MVGCTIACVTSELDECRCACDGANHGTGVSASVYRLRPGGQSEADTGPRGRFELTPAPPAVDSLHRDAYEVQVGRRAKRLT